MNSNSRFIINDNIHVLKNMNRIILANKNNGQWIKLSKECYEIILQLIKKDYEFDEIFNCFVLDEDRDYMKDLMFKLIESEILVTRSEISKPKLKSMSLMLSNKCNLKCIHCCEDIKYDHNKTILSTDQVMKVIDIILREDFEYITITGGEPLTRTDTKEICIYLREKFSGKVALLTNGLLINKDNITWIISTFDSISISIDGCDDELTSFVRGEGVFKKTIETIKLLHSYNYQNISLSAILPNSFEVENQFNDLCKVLNVKPQIRYLSYQGRGNTNKEKINRKYDEYMKKYNYQKYNYFNYETSARPGGCAAGTVTLSIDSYGNVFPCNLLHTDVYNMGNIIEDQNIINTISENPIYIKALALKSFENTRCADCNINIFCWSCISEFDEYMNGLGDFEKRCSVKKDRITREIWGE